MKSGPNRLKELTQIGFQYVERGSADSLTKLLQMYSDVQLSDVVDDRGYTLLHEACF